MKLFLKGTRCDTPKCGYERRNAPPGQQQQGRRVKPTDYGIHLREKQKVKHYYSVLERQFRNYFSRAERAKRNTGDALMTLLELRFDNVVHRLGFGQSRAQARQIIVHGHLTVHGRRVDVPSYSVRPGDMIRVNNRPKSVALVQANVSQNERLVPDFLNLLEGPVPEGQMTRHPEAFDVSIPVEARLIIELCSK